MNIRFYVSTDPTGAMKPRVLNVASALQAGARAFGDRVEIVHNGSFKAPAENVDVACCWGIIGNAKDIVGAYRAAGKRVLMFDKALIRRLASERIEHFRVGIDGPSPEKYIMRAYRDWRRWESHRIDIKPRQVLPERGAAVYAGSSQKYCDFYGLGDANRYADKVLAGVRKRLAKIRLVYRPKPSWKDAQHLDGVDFSGSRETLLDLLKSTHVLITHGSAAAVEAIVSGVPAITLGPCAAAPVSGRSLDDVSDPVFVSDEARWQFCCQLAHCQWTAAELRSGEAWQFLRGELEATAGVPS